LISVFQEDLKFSRPGGDLEQGVNRFFYLPLLPLRDQL
jgi:hypothetical protein